MFRRSAYPAAPDSEYGWEKLFSERLYLTYHRNYGIEVRVARFHNIFGPQGTWKVARKKRPQQFAEKWLQNLKAGRLKFGEMENKHVLFLCDECVDGIRRLMESDFTGPVNIGSEEMISINDFAKMVIEFRQKHYQ